MFRVFVVALLTVVLPVRGAIGATMACAAGSEPPAQIAALEHDGVTHDDGAHAHAGHARHTGATSVADGTRHGPADTNAHQGGDCQLCMAGCHAVPLAGAVPTLGAAPICGLLTFPATSAPPAAFESDGQERPPRTI